MLFAVYWGVIADGGVATLPVVVDFDVVEDHVNEVDASTPLFTVKKLDLPGGPKRLEPDLVSRMVGVGRFQYAAVSAEA